MDYNTAYCLFRSGKFPRPTEQLPTGTILVHELPSRTNDAILYARVSSSSQKEDLQRQLDRLRADWAKAGRSDRYMKEVLAYILRARGTPVSWLGMARETSIGSPHTTQAYVETLEGLLVALVLELLTPQGKMMHRRNKEVHFADPLAYRAFSAFSGVQVDEAALVEGVVASHLSRRWETYYWKDGTEVDAVVREDGREVGVETKWGFRKGFRPRHLASAYISLDRRTVPLFLASLKL